MKAHISRREVTLTFAAALCGTVIPFRTGYGQAAPVQQFDVSTVKPTNEASPSGYGFAIGHGRIEMTNFTLESSIMRAYAVGPHQVAGGPNWVYSDRFDIQGKVDPPTDDTGLIMKLLQGLLVDRFKLTFHRETRTILAQVLEVDKNGPKVEKAEGVDPEVETSKRGGRGSYSFRNTDMDTLVRILARETGLPVANATGLKGNFNFTLHWTLDTASPSTDAATDTISIFAALQEQLGLRLRSAKAPMEVLVIDHVERPSAN